MVRTLILVLLAGITLPALAHAQDVCAPGAVTSLATQTYYGNIRLAWTAPGDDCLSGNAATWELRYSASPISDTNWQSASIHTTGSAASQGGAECALYDKQCPGAVSYYFTVFYFDEVGNRSPFGGSVQGSTRCSGSFQVGVCDN
jgi:hypothetical protein